MLIAVVSDTHGHAEFTRQAIRMLEGFEIALVIHCGDIGSDGILPLFHRWPLHFVFGNVDARTDPIRRSALANQTCHDRFGQLQVAGRDVAFLHGDDEARLQQAIRCGTHDLVCYGHTHVAEQHRQGPTLVLNPGALYRAHPHSVAVVDLVTLAATHLPL
jgi:putative phosphoesterase